MELLIATSNAGKVREFQQMLEGGPFTCCSLADFPHLAPVQETGHTFRANAVLKATGYSQLTRLWSLADDSGLEVDALDAKPGVHSARWAQLHDAGKTDADNNALLLSQMAGIPQPQRLARFVCVLALSDPAGRIVLTTRGLVEGRIGFTPVGDHGFGYDPLFIVNALGRTTAELSPEQKHQISHRGNALQRLKGLLERIEL